MKFLKRLLFVVPALLCMFVHNVSAHDLWLNVDNHYPKPGEKVLAEVVFGHNYPYYDILISKKELSEFSFIDQDGQKRVVENVWEKEKCSVGEILVNQKGTYIVAASRKRKGDKEHVASEKYAKSIIVAEGTSTNLSQQFQHKIEIIPLKNPADVAAGSSFPVKILFNGEPLSAYVYATYVGYFSEDEPMPVITRSNEQGLVDIPISQKGTWMVVCNHKVDFSASLTFQIR